MSPEGATPPPSFDLTEQVLRLLIKGDSLKTREIADELSARLGREIRTRSVARVLSRISDPDKCDLGFFFKKVKSGGALVYGLADEVRRLSAGQVYGLTRRSGPDRYSLNDALSEHPPLRSFVTTVAHGSPPSTAGHAAASRQVMADPGGPSPFRSPSAGGHGTHHQRVDMSFRYSDRYDMAFSLSIRHLIGIGIAAVLSIALLAFIAYLFLWPLFLIILVLCILAGGGHFLKKVLEKKR